MKQKLLYGLMLVVMSLCSVSSWAERERPTCPATTLESGKTYYLYNVEADLFLATSSNSSYLGVNETAIATEFTQMENGAWVMRFTNGSANYYHRRDNEYILNNWNSKDFYETWWAITPTGENSSYTIQTSPLNTYRYNADQYVGWVGNNSTYVYADRPADGNIHWIFIPADDSGDRFVAELKLYKELELADGYYENLKSYYEDLYTNRATSDPEEMTNAAYALRNGLKMSNGYKAPYWNEYPILWATSDGSFGDNYIYTWALPDGYYDIDNNYHYYSIGTYFDRNFQNGSSTLSATVNVDELSTFVYSTSGSYDDDAIINVYVDDVLVRTLKGNQKDDYPTSKTYARFAEVLQPGKHTIKWVASTTSTNSNRSFQIRNAGVIKSPLITVSLLEPGSLGTEVLYNTDHIKNVRRLKVIGKMNQDDWDKVKMMSGLLDLDLSEAQFKEIPENQFQVQYNDTVMQFLHRLILPEGLEKINEKAFYYSFIDTLALPSTLKNIRESAFAHSHIQHINMPDDCTEIYGTNTYNDYPVFNCMYQLKHLVCAKNWTVIPESSFQGCDYVETVKLPENLIEIGEWAFAYDRYMTIEFPEKLETIAEYAFANCHNAQFGSFPESLQRIWQYSFQNCYGLTNIIIPKNVSTLREGVFENCYNIKTAELSVHQYAIADYLFNNCGSLETLRLNSPTVATVTDNSSNYPVDADKIANVDLIVPSFLVNAYKLHKYWYNFKSITGFSTAEIQDWVINNQLVLNHDRFEGNPNITINGYYGRMPSLKFNGTNAQNINNLTIGGSYNTDSWSGKDNNMVRYNNYPGQIYSNGENIKVNGEVKVSLYTPAKTWRFFSLPFDVKIADITHSASDVQYKIGYYNGADRALYGTNGSWKDAKGKEVTNPEELDVETEYSETSGNSTNSNGWNRVLGTSFAIGENGEVYGSNNNGYTLMNTDVDNQIKIRVNEGYKITKLTVTAYSDNSSSKADRSIILTGAYIDGNATSVLAENVTFPGGNVGRTPTAAVLEDISATKLIRLTFDNSNIASYEEDYYGCNKQIYAKIEVSYKNVAEESGKLEIIPAGTGFIIQTNKDTWNYFHAVDNDMKQNLVSYKEFEKTLEVNPSEKKANVGWNLIGNPYQCFYNNHMLNFTAPITVWNAYDNKYIAYSITDDDYAIRPNEAFFVQCPSAEYNTISFPLQGRQLNDVIESQNAAPAKYAAAKNRQLINLTLTADDESNDQTRVVLNENASLDYEMSCDASKFMSMDNSVPQLFTLDDEGTQYAINERPIEDGVVALGFYAAKGGTFTLSLDRCDANAVYLTDKEEGITTEISAGEYTFVSEAGTFNKRFELTFEAGTTTGLDSLNDATAEGVKIYNLSGQRVDNINNAHGIFIRNGKKIVK